MSWTTPPYVLAPKVRKKQLDLAELTAAILGDAAGDIAKDKKVKLDSSVDTIVEGQKKSDKVVKAAKDSSNELYAPDDSSIIEAVAGGRRHPLRHAIKQENPDDAVYGASNMPDDGSFYYAGSGPSYGGNRTAVSAIQQILGTDDDTGYYTDETQKAVADFQRAHGLAATGKFDHATAAAMNNESTKGMHQGSDLTPRDINELMVREQTNDYGKKPVQAPPTLVNSEYDTVAEAMGSKDRDPLFPDKDEEDKPPATSTLKPGTDEPKTFLDEPAAGPDEQLKDFTLPSGTIPNATVPGVNAAQDILQGMNDPRYGEMMKAGMPGAMSTNPMTAVPDAILRVLNMQDAIQPKPQPNVDTGLENQVNQGVELGNAVGQGVNQEQEDRRVNSIFGLDPAGVASDVIGGLTEGLPEPKEVKTAGFDPGATLGNFGQGLQEMTRHLPHGIANMVGAAADEVNYGDISVGGAGVKVGEGGPMPEDRGVYNRILKPIGEHYGEYYGDPDKWSQNFQNDPLSLLLDVGTVLSLGAGAATKGAQAIRQSGFRGAEAAEDAATGARFTAGPEGVVDNGPGAIDLDMGGDPSLFDRILTGVQNFDEGKRAPAAGPRFEHNGQEFHEPAYPRGRGSRGVARRAFQTIMDQTLGEGSFLSHIPGPASKLRAGAAKAERTYRGHKIMDKEHALGGMRHQEMTETAARPLVAAMKPLAKDPEQGIAAWLLMHGVNHHPLPDGSTTAERQAAQWDKAMSNEFDPEDPVWGNRNWKDQSVEDTDKITMQYVNEWLKDPNSKLSQYMTHPTEAMEGFALEWRAALEETKKMFPEELTPEKIHEHEWGVQQDLLRDDDYMGRAAPGPDDLKGFYDDAIADYVNPVTGRNSHDLLRPTYLPEKRAEGQLLVDDAGLRWVDQSKGGFFARKAGINQSAFTQGQARADSAVARTPSFLEESQRDLYFAGVARMDPHSVIAHIGERTAKLAEMDGLAKMMRDSALRDESGMVPLFDGPSDFLKQVGRDKADQYDLMYLEPDLKFFRAREDAASRLMKATAEAAAKGEHVPPEFMTNLVHEFMVAHPEQFVKEWMGVSRGKAFAVPKSMKKRWDGHMDAAMDFNNNAGKAYRYYMNKWTASTLALMPRWWINNTVGTAMLTALSGQLTPRNVWTATRMAKGRHRYIFDDEVERTGMKVKELAKARLAESQLERALAPATRERDLAPGMHQGFVASERLEGKASGLAQSGVVSRGIFTGVQGIEDFFRTVQAVGHARNIGGWHDVGVPRTHIPGKADDDYIDALLRDPDVLSQVIDRSNNFSYNFMDMAPWERKWVRLGAPFYGWLKFITKLTWKMPFDFPGRSNLMYQLQQVGTQDTIDRYFNGNEAVWNAIPQYQRDKVITDTSAQFEKDITDGDEAVGDQILNIKGFSVRGTNPFSWGANPSGEGGVSDFMDIASTAPIIQGGLKVAGFDPFTKDTVSINPDSGYIQGLFNTLVNPYEGDDIAPGVADNVGQVDWVKRGLSAVQGMLGPQVQFASDVAAGGKPQYPSSNFVTGIEPRDVKRPEGYEDPSMFERIFRTGTGVDIAPVPSRYNVDFMDEQGTSAASQDLNRRIDEITKAKAAGSDTSAMETEFAEKVRQLNAIPGRLSAPMIEKLKLLQQRGF